LVNKRTSTTTKVDGVEMPMIAGCLTSEASDRSGRSGFTVLRMWQRSYSVLQWASMTRCFTRMKPLWVCLA